MMHAWCTALRTCHHHGLIYYVVHACMRACTHPNARTDACVHAQRQPVPTSSSTSDEIFRLPQKRRAVPPCQGIIALRAAVPLGTWHATHARTCTHRCDTIPEQPPPPARRRRSDARVGSGHNAGGVSCGTADTHPQYITRRGRTVHVTRTQGATTGSAQRHVHTIFVR